jgi:cephalosporin hydroxylase
MSLWETFLSQSNTPIYKWAHYFPIYEIHFAQHRNRSLTFLEIGVAWGGSAKMWSKYFGPMTKIIGIDIDPNCKQHECNNISIRIGDQSDPKFLQSIIDEFGVPDIVLDDGSHQQNHINSTFEFLYPKMDKNSIYMIEDLHTAYWPDWQGGLTNPNTFINKSKGYIDQLNLDHTKGQLERNPLLDNTFAISFYDSIAVFEKGEPYAKKDVWSGND